MKPPVSELTYENYRRMLDCFRKRGYAFAAFQEVDEERIARQPFVLLRHDIDLDLGKARRMAEMEAEERIAATYFLMVRTMHYNVFSCEGSAEVRAILGAGHHLGLHFDCAVYAGDARTEELARACRVEAEMLERWFDCPVTAVSFHRPGPRVLSGDPELSSPRPHTYTELFARRVRYYSDSRGQWRHGWPSESETFHQRKPMQILVHPIWWHEKPVVPYQTLVEFVARARAELEQSVARNNSVYRLDAAREP